MIIGDIDVHNVLMWDKHCENSCKLVLEDTILIHAFYVDTNTSHISPVVVLPITIHPVGFEPRSF